MFRDDLQLAKGCRTLPAQVTSSASGPNGGPTSEALSLLDRDGGPISSGERILLLAVARPRRRCSSRLQRGRRHCLPAMLRTFRCPSQRSSITLHQESGGKLEDPQALAGHADARTTRLYVRKERKIAQAEVKRVQL